MAIIIDDNRLAFLAANKDERAFEEIINRYGGLIKAIVRYHLKDISMWQDDCINDILFAIWQNIDRFDPEKNTLKNWIGAVSKYRSINYKRKFYRELTTGELREDISDGKDIDTELIKQEIEDETKSLLSGLNEQDREIFIKRYFLEQPVESIAADADKKTSWVYGRLSRGRNRLRRIIGTERSN
ncbi:MAG: sigma-70 family RNA polymerase sigma factor [Oscillospiraceae bacterium]|nr:sigma-70 family RNA polymerase sigma factor [Oscillospiraceae bacterium]